MTLKLTLTFEKVGFYSPKIVCSEEARGFALSSSGVDWSKRGSRRVDDWACAKGTATPLQTPYSDANTIKMFVPYEKSP